MPFCVHGEPDHKCKICQASRLPEAVVVLDAPKMPALAPPTVLRPVVMARPIAPSSPIVIPKTVPRSMPSGPPPSILVNSVAKQGPVSSGTPVVPSNPLVRGGGVRASVQVVQEFWRTYRMLGVTDLSAEQAIAASILQSEVAVVDGFESLELAEKYALYKYTSVEYLKWNDFLRNKKGNYKAHCDLVALALDKLNAEPEYATTYRIEKFSETRHLPLFTRGAVASGTLKVGTEINFAAFTSTAFNVAVVESDPQFSGAGSYVKYIISGHTGKRVNFLSTKSVECEILISKGAKFRIKGGPDQKMVFDSVRRSGAIEIELEQVI